MPRIDTEYLFYNCPHCHERYAIRATYKFIHHCPYCLRADETTTEEVNNLEAALAKAKAAQQPPAPMTNGERFIEDMDRAGIGLYDGEYHGRGGYVGPAAVVDDPDEVREATKLKVSSDNLGLRYVVYPRAPKNEYKEVE